MNTEQQATQQARLDILAPQIAASLQPAGAWTSGPGQQNYYDVRAILTGPDGAELGLSLDYGRGTHLMRLTVRTEMNGLRSHMGGADHEVKSEITVSPDKDPAKIATDIERRLLPQYLEVMARAQVNKARYDETLAGIHATVAMIVARYQAHNARVADVRNGSYPGDTV